MTNNSKVTGRIWPEFELVRHFMPALVTRQCKSMGAFGCRGNPSFDPNVPQNIMQPFPNSNDDTYIIKIGQLASEIFNFESVDDGRAADH